MLAAKQKLSASGKTPKQPYFGWAEAAEKKAESAFEIKDFEGAKKLFLDAKRFYDLAGK
jgi:hypothetical protein